jgi:polyhydroxyalkanoate synthesis regulator phasin
MSMSKIVNKIIAYESGELSAEETLELFSELVKSGQAWALQGHYGRIAQNYIDNGFLDRNGNILRHFIEDEG